MVQAGSGICAALEATKVDGVLCCKTTAPPPPPPPVQQKVEGGACLTYPTRVQAYVWAYVWPSD
jgi:hypothetical protein